MQLVKNPNNWSCLLASMAMVLNKTTDELIEEIGHNGSVVVFPELPEPAKREGFHIQEFIPIILKSGFSMMAIEALPYSTPDGKHEWPVKFAHQWQRFWMLTDKVPGIFTGLSTKWRHAVAWDGNKFYDPKGEIYYHDKCPIQIDVFYRFDRIKS